MRAAFPAEVANPVKQAGRTRFLGTQQSLALMNSEYYYPHTSDRQSRDNWAADGGLDMRERARLKAHEILRSHKPDPIPAEIDTAIRERFEILLPPDFGYSE